MRVVGTWLWSALAVCVGCSETHEHGCGEGAALKHAGANYCVYEASIIEEGFSCPAHVPNEYDFDGFKACGVPAEPPDDLDERIFEVFRADASTSDAGGTCEINGRTYNYGDEFCAEDGCNTCGCGPRATPCSTIGCNHRSDAGMDAGSCTPGEIIVREPRPDASVPDAGRGGLDYHLTPVPTDPVSLRLYEDGTFEWMQDGCGYRTGTSGRYEPGGASIFFMPGAGQSTFSWIDPRTSQTVELETLRGGIETEGRITFEFGSTTQVWESGGKCPVCEELEPTGSVDCVPVYGP